MGPQGTCREPSNLTPMAVNSISFGSPHVRCTPMWALSNITCAEPNESKKNTHPKYITALFREQGRSIAGMPGYMQVRIRVARRSIPPPWGSIRLRLAPRTYDAPPWGVRVVSQTKSRKMPTRNILPLFSVLQDAGGIPHYRNLTSLDDDFFYKIQAVYLGMISYTDWIFGQLLKGLAKIEGGAMAGRTAVFFSSDHGDFAGDYGLVEKWPGSMADVLTRVPLYARLPAGYLSSSVSGQGHAVQGHVSQAPVQTADVLETMYPSRAVQFHPHGGQFDFVWLSARTPHGGASYVWRVVSQTKSREIPTRNTLPLFVVIRLDLANITLPGWIRFGQ